MTCAATTPATLVERIARAIAKPAKSSARPAFGSGRDLDRARLAGAICDAMVFLDNVVETSHYPFSGIEAMTRPNAFSDRRTLSARL